MNDKLRVNIETDSSLNMLENKDKGNVENIYPVNLEFLSYFKLQPRRRMRKQSNWLY